MEAPHSIKPLQPSQLQEAMDLVWRGFGEHVAADCSPEGVEEFRSYIALPAMEERIAAGQMWLWACRDSRRLTGVIAITPAHVSLLFVEQDCHGQGIARALMETALSHCKAAWPQTPVTVNASPYAVKAYRALGFFESGPPRTKNGISFVPMVCNRYVL